MDGFVWNWLSYAPGPGPRQSPRTFPKGEKPGGESIYTDMVFYYHKGTMNDWRERVSDMKVLVTPRDGMRTRFLDGIHARESMTLTEDMFTMDGYILPSGTKIYV